jgi:hypothetical protein
MAEILTRREIGSLSVTPYSKIRGKLETGDLYLSKDESFLYT